MSINYFNTVRGWHLPILILLKTLLLFTQTLFKLDTGFARRELCQDTAESRLNKFCVTKQMF